MTAAVGLLPNPGRQNGTVRRPADLSCWPLTKSSQKTLSAPERPDLEGYFPGLPRPWIRRFGEGHGRIVGVSLDDQTHRGMPHDEPLPRRTKSVCRRLVGRSQETR